MSLADLPEEILSKIVKGLLASCKADTCFYKSYEAPSTQSIWVENYYLVPLASTNRQLRRVCLPDVFSHVVVRKNDEAQSPWKDGLGLLLRTVRLSPHLAQLITSIRTQDEPHENISDQRLFELLIKELPHLRHIPAVRLDDPDLVNAVFQHPSLERIEVILNHRSFPSIYHPSDPKVMHKVWMRKLAIISHEETSITPQVRAYCALGMHVQNIQVRATPPNITWLLSPELGLQRVHAIKFDFLGATRGDAFGGRLPELLRYFPELERIVFAGLHNNRLPSGLPLLPRLALSRDVTAWVPGYALERVTPSDEATSSEDIWKDWSVISLTIHNCYSTQQLLETVAHQAPNLRWLKINSGSRSTNSKLMDFDEIACGISCFKNLYHLSMMSISFVGVQTFALFRNESSSESAGSQRKIFDRDLEVALRQLKEACPSLESISGKFMSSPLEICTFDARVRWKDGAIEIAE